MIDQFTGKTHVSVCVCVLGVHEGVPLPPRNLQSQDYIEVGYTTLHYTTTTTTTTTTTNYTFESHYNEIFPENNFLVTFYNGEVCGGCHV